MNAAREACRPKHQVLVLKCYPKFQKNNQEVRANSSELSYLLYYASTRRSKLQKVGDFLEKRTTADVWKGRIGNVQVTLEILRALIEKCPRDLPLYAGAVLRMLRAILKSADVAMLEASVPTFEALCAHQDPPTLAADQEYIKQYEEVVQLYARFASRETDKNPKAPVSWPVAIRLRKAGLQALKAAAASESLGSETGRQLAVVIPAILLNIYSESGDYLKRLESRGKDDEDHEKELALKRRHSISTVRTGPEDGEGDAAAVFGTTEDADKTAEEEVGVIALQALRSIYVGVNRSQLRLATSAVLKFVADNVKPQQDVGGGRNWATTLLALVCGWAPVQDRYAILVGAMETLIRSPIVEDDLERQLTLATIINYLLSSSINFIGLSVMDVLVGLISHILLLLQLGGSRSTIKPHHQQDTSLADNQVDGQSTEKVTGLVMEVVKEPSPFRLQLLETLQKSMASLATHVYYTDQISDMISAILSRLKPSPAAGTASIVEAIEDPVGAANAVASSASLQERSPHIDKFFSFETARVLALEAVKAIIITANTRRPDGSSASVSRSPVGVSVWEGTQWLLRDPSGKVRKAYVDALITWLNLEKKKDDLKLVEDYRRKEKAKDRAGLARRAVSNASTREKSPKRGKNTFLALLHLAIFENALQYTDSEPDLLLLHVLLTTLVNKLGVNAVRTSLPMIWHLQEVIQNIENPGAKIRIGSLVHGYLWALSIAFDFETSTVGRALHTEISRRGDKGLWVKNIRVPAFPVERIETPHADPIRLPADVVQTEALNPFDNREALIDRIAHGYSASLQSPPSSPPSSPGRSFSVPRIQTQTLSPTPQLSTKLREELLSEWTKEVCIAANTKDSSSASMTGSRTGTSTHNKNNFLGVQIPNGGLDSANNSPMPSPRRPHSRPPSIAYGLVGRVASPHRNHSPSRTPGSTSSARSAVRVDDLKRILSGSAPRTSYSIRPASRHYRASPDSSASESMISVHSLSDASFVTADHQMGGSRTNLAEPATALTTSTATPMPTFTPAPSASSPTATNAIQARDAALTSDVPPVPPIPENLRDKPASPPAIDSSGRPKTAPSAGNGSISIRKGRSTKRNTGGSRSVREGSGSRTRNANGHADFATAGITTGGKKAAAQKQPDFSRFLDSIDVGGDDDDDEGEENEAVMDSKGVGKAPY